MEKDNPQFRRLLRRLASGAIWKDRHSISTWLGRDAGAVLRYAEDCGVMVNEKRVRKNYVAASWRI